MQRESFFTRVQPGVAVRHLIELKFLRERRSPEKSNCEVSEIASCLLPVIFVRRIEAQIVCDVRIQVACIEQDVCDGLINENELPGNTCIVNWVCCKKYSIDCIEAIKGQSIWISHVVGDIVKKKCVVCRKRVGPVEEQCLCSDVSCRDVVSAPILQTAVWKSVCHPVSEPFKKG